MDIDLGNNAVLAFVVLAVIVLLAVVLYVAWRLRRQDLTSRVAISGSRKLNTRTPARVAAASLPSTLNGREYTLSFWVYLSGFDATALPKLILMRGGNGSDSVAAASSLVFMDGKTNRMYIALSTNKSSQAAVTGLDSVLDPANKFVIATVDYVPMQRWVHFTAVAQDHLLSVYVDGDLYTVEDAGGAVLGGATGDLVVGAVKGTARATGAIANVTLFNYAVGSNEVKRVYEHGPGSSAWHVPGMDKDLALRSPVYRIYDNGSTSCGADAAGNSADAADSTGDGSGN